LAALTQIASRISQPIYAWQTNFITRDNIPNFFAGVSGKFKKALHQPFTSPLPALHRLNLSIRTQLQERFAYAQRA
jgi:hypothetical protein